VPDWVKPSFVIFDIRVLLATVGVKGLILLNTQLNVTPSSLRPMRVPGLFPSCMS